MKELIDAYEVVADDLDELIESVGGWPEWEEQAWRSALAIVREQLRMLKEPEQMLCPECEARLKSI